MEVLHPLPAVEPSKTQSSLSPDDPHWNSWTGVLTWAASVAAILLLPSVFLAVYAGYTGVRMDNADQLVAWAKTNPTAIIVQISAIFPAHLFTLALGWAVVTGFGKRPFFESLGWRTAGVRWWHYIAMLLGFMALSVVFTSILPVQEDDMERIVRSSRTALYLVAAMAVLTAPIVEEVIYRGVLYSPLKSRLGTAAAVALVTVLFTAVHVPQYAENPAKIGLLALLSLGLTLLRAATGNLLPCIILHTLINATNSSLLIAEPYLRTLVPAPIEGFVISLFK